MSTSNATIISPIITKQSTIHIKTENIKKEENESNNCILFISSPRENASTNTVSSGTNILIKSEESLDVRNGHNYTATTSAIKIATTSGTITTTNNNTNQQNTSATASFTLRDHQQNHSSNHLNNTINSTTTTTTTTTANNRSSTVKIEFPLSSSKQVNHNNSNTTPTSVNTNVSLFSIQFN